MNIPPDSGGLRSQNEPLNNLNRDNSSWFAGVTNVAVNFVIPFMIPAATAFIGWFAHKQVSAKVAQLEEQKEENKKLIEKINDLQDIIGFQDLRKDHGENTTRFPQFKPPSEFPSREQKKKIEDEENEKLKEIHQDLNTISDLLQKRQNIYCETFTSRKHRIVLEDELKKFSYSKYYDKDLELYKGVLNIFENDGYCDPNGRRNGCLMWVYLDFWKLQAKQMTKERVDRRVAALTKVYGSEEKSR